MAKGAIWTDDELEFIAANAGRMSYQQIADHLNRSEPSVRSKACRMGVGGRKFGILHHRKLVKTTGRKRKA